VHGWPTKINELQLLNRGNLRDFAGLRGTNPSALSGVVSLDNTDVMIWSQLVHNRRLTFGSFRKTITLTDQQDDWIKARSRRRSTPMTANISVI
jgi:hypothetical protein